MRKRLHPSLESHPIPVTIADVDLIRFEQNLLKIGFFGVQDYRPGEGTQKRIVETTADRDGQRIKASSWCC